MEGGPLSELEIDGLFHVTTDLPALRATEPESRWSLRTKAAEQYAAGGLPRPVPSGFGGGRLGVAEDRFSVTWSMNRAWDLANGLKIAIRSARYDAQPAEIVKYLLDVHGMPQGVEAAFTAGFDLDTSVRLYVAYLVRNLLDACQTKAEYLIRAIGFVTGTPDCDVKRDVLGSMAVNLTRSIGAPLAAEVLSASGLFDLVTLTHEVEPRSSEYNQEDIAAAKRLLMGATASLQVEICSFDGGDWKSALLEWFRQACEQLPVLNWIRDPATLDAWPSDLALDYLSEQGLDLYELLQELDSHLGLMTSMTGWLDPEIGFTAPRDEIARMDPEKVGIVVLLAKVGAEVEVCFDEWEIRCDPADLRLRPLPESELLLNGSSGYSQAQIEDMISVITGEMGNDPVAIDSGMCDEFAERLEAMLGPGARVINPVLSSPFYGHVWVEYRGRCYDAETSEGVERPQDLGFYLRVKGPAGAAWYG